MLRLLSHYTLLGLLGLSLSQSLWANPSDEVIRQLIVKFEFEQDLPYREAVSTELLAQISAHAGIDLNFKRLMSQRSQVLRLPEPMPLSQLQPIVDKLNAHPAIIRASKDGWKRRALTPDDPDFAQQWYLENSAIGMDAQNAWDDTQGSTAVTIAIVDTGFTPHEYYSGNSTNQARILSGYDFVSDADLARDGDASDSDPTDEGDYVLQSELDGETEPDLSAYTDVCIAEDSSWHGTAVASVAAAKGNDTIGMAGINWQANLLFARVLGSCGGYDSDIIDGMLWSAGLNVPGATNNGNPADVINLSLGGAGECTESFQDAINSILAQPHNPVVVIAAGNSAADVVDYTPANCEGVIAVAATNGDGNRASYSNFGAIIDISAPGGEDGTDSIYAAVNDGTTTATSNTDQYLGYSGTSFAAPLVSGVVSLVKTVDPSLDADEIRQLLNQTARSFPSGSDCTSDTCGSGMLDGGSAVNQAITGYVPPEDQIIIGGDGGSSWSWALLLALLPLRLLRRRVN